MNTEEIISEAKSLPVEQRLHIANSLLESLNPPNEGFDQEWVAVSNERLKDLRSGKVKPISGSQVFSKVEDLLR